jgi:hypothetical protein
VREALAGDRSEAVDDLEECNFELLRCQPCGHQLWGGAIRITDVLEIQHVVGVADRIRHVHARCPQAGQHLVLVAGPAILQ